MRIVQRDGLLFVPVTIQLNGITQTIPDLVLDTGAAHSIINLSAVEALDVGAENGDEFVFLSGIGGKEPALRKRIDVVQFGGYTVEQAYMDFGDLGEHQDINGLLGSDILVNGRFIIDLDEMTLYQRTDK